ncbi:hypothetical protein Tco_0391357, partial [Tanacetum coccineum]
IQLQDMITSLKIQLDGLKVENVSLKRLYGELSQANTHSRTAYTEKLSALTAGKTSSGPSTSETPKANTHSRTANTEKLSALTAENTKLKAQVTGKTSNGPSTSETPKVLAPGMYNLGSKYIPPPKQSQLGETIPVA